MTYKPAFYAYSTVLDGFVRAYSAIVAGSALADAGPNARPGRGAQCKT